MTDGYLYRQMRRCNRNLLFLCFIFLCIALMFLSVSLHNYRIYKTSPIILDVNKVLDDSYSPGLFSNFFYVAVYQKNYIDTGTEDFRTSLMLRKSNKQITDSSDYILVPYNNYWLPIRFDDEQGSIREVYKGKLVGIDSYVLAEIKVRANKKNIPEFDPNKVLNKAIAPEAFNLFTRIDFWIGICFFIVFFIGTLKAGRRYFSYYRSPIFTQLEIYGEIPILHELIDCEAERGLKLANKIIITKSWFLSERFLTLDIAPLWSCVSAYTKKRIKFVPFTFIPIFRYTELNIILRNKVQYVASLISPWNVQDILTVLKENAPWIVFGDSKIIKKLVKQDFQSLLIKVDNVQKQLEN